ncbi:hypothetical protein OC846_001731 [Tilletia horrida]|uniref:CCD97-like C-terminal domain-containing protein n=1 Tax=Tilletia horrida TaxID=155126 RepID=A0AAN6JST3_9BASI|nr:hypothetical protein OC846_001731 [Tilletia horrida]
MARFGQLEGEKEEPPQNASSSTPRKLDVTQEDRIVDWLAHATSSSSSIEPLNSVRNALRTSLRRSPLEFLNAHVYALPAPLLAELPLTVAERGLNRVIASRRRVYARRHAPDILGASGSKDRLGGLWSRYSEGRSSVAKVEEERERNARKRARQEQIRQLSQVKDTAAGLSPLGKGKQKDVSLGSSAGRQSTEPVDLVGLAEAKHPSLGEYFDGADDPKAAAEERGLTGSSSDDAQEEEEETDEEDTDAPEFDASGQASVASREAPSTTGDIAVSAFERHALSLFVAGTDPTLPRSLYDSIDFDERWDVSDEDADENGGLAREPRRSTEGRVGSLPGLTDEDAYFMDDEDE